jgi:hypothetical protein
MFSRDDKELPRGKGQRRTASIIRTMEKFLSIAYGSFVRSEQNFLIHTYLSIFAKMLAYTVVSNDEYIDDAEMREIIDGSIFHRFNITNFVQNDFFTGSSTTLG